MYKVQWIHENKHWVGGEFDGHWEKTAPDDECEGFAVSFFSDTANGETMAVIIDGSHFITKPIDEIKFIGELST